LKISLSQPKAVGLAGIVVAHQGRNNAFNRGPEAHIELEGRGLGVEQGGALAFPVVTDEDTSAPLSASLAIGGGFGRFVRLGFGCCGAWRRVRCRGGHSGDGEGWVVACTGCVGGRDFLRFAATVRPKWAILALGRSKTVIVTIGRLRTIENVGGLAVRTGFDVSSAERSVSHLR